MEKENNHPKTRNDSVANPIVLQPFPLWKQFTIFLVGWVGFRTIAAIVQIALYIGSYGTGLSMEELFKQPEYAMLTNALSYIALFIALMSISNKDLPKLAKTFKGFKPFLAGAICLAAIFTFNATYSNILSYLISVNDNQNENPEGDH